MKMRILKALCSAIVIMALPCALKAGGESTKTETLIDNEKGIVHLTVSIDGGALKITRTSGWDRLRLDGWGYLGEAGKPMLPARTFWVALPAGMKVTGVAEAVADARTLAGSYRIPPAQPPTPIDGQAAPRAATGPDPEVYSSKVPYPPERVLFLNQADLAGQGMAAISVRPVQYVPANGSLTFAERIDIVIEGTFGYEYGDYLPARATPHTQDMYEHMVAEKVVNPEDVELLRAPMMPLIQGVAPGAFDYVIITTTGWADDFQPLADWRTRLGLRAAVVTTEWIYNSGGYAGSNLEKIRAFIVDAHSTWGAECFLLGADTDNIPYHIRSITVPTYGTDDIPNDTYYADYDDDWVCEVNVGRASVRSAADISTFIGKVFTYEQNPPLTDYAKEAVYFGFDISTCGDMDGENFKEDYIRPYFPGPWTIDTEYDSEAGSHRDDVLAYLEHGYHLVNHHDHCNENCMGTGWICHGDLMYTADINALTNGDRLSILFAVGCNPARPSTYRSIGEASILNPNGGCIAFMGNSFTGWGGPPEEPDLYSLGQDKYFYRNLFELGIHRLGDNYTLLKNDEFDFDDPYNLHKYAFTQLHLLGDPGLSIWTDDPQALAVSHPAGAPVGQATTFTVEVASTGNPVDGATVCLWKDGEVYEVGETSAGSVTLAFTAATEGTLFVTASKPNYIPYRGAADVNASASVDPENADRSVRPGIVRVSPNPANGTTCITYALPFGSERFQANLAIYDCLGRHVRTLVTGAQPGGVHSISWDGRDERAAGAASGVYYCELTWDGGRDSRQILLMK